MITDQLLSYLAFGSLVLYTVIVFWTIVWYHGKKILSKIEPKDDFVN